MSFTYSKLRKFQSCVILYGTDYVIRNDKVTVDVAVQPKLKMYFFRKTIRNLEKFEKGELVSIYSLDFVCNYVVLGVILTPPRGKWGKILNDLI